MRLVPKPYSFFLPTFDSRHGAILLSSTLSILVSIPAGAQTAPAPETTPASNSSLAPAPDTPPTAAPSDEEAEPSSEGTAEPEETSDSSSPTAPATEDVVDGEPEPAEGTDEPTAPTERSASAADEDGWMKLEESAAGLQEKPPESRPYFRTMLLVEGTARYGAVTIAPPGASLEDDDPDAFESSVGNLGGQVTLGVMPGGSAFTMAGRLRGGSYISDQFTRGNMSAEMLFGANFGRNARGNEFTHILGGFGVEFLPGENQDLLTLSVGAATVVKGVSFGGGFQVGANDEVAIATLGMQVGWGQLF